MLIGEWVRRQNEKSRMEAEAWWEEMVSLLEGSDREPEPLAIAIAA